MDIKEVRKVVGKIQSNLFKNSNSFSVGMLRSHFKGTGLQFKEHQVYSHGDDVRFIDWKLLAKTSHPYIKTFEEERNVEIVVVLDASPTMFMGYKGTSKLQASIEICCLLYLLAQATGDFIHVVLIADEVVNIPKRSGEEGIALLISVLEDIGILDCNGRVNIAYRSHRGSKGDNRVAAIMKHLGKRREVVLLSDFNEFIEANILKKMMYRKNVHCFQIIAPIDEADKLPYKFFSSRRVDGKKACLGTVDLGGAKELKRFFGKKVKQLKVQDRYLEDFIKEML